MLDVGIIGAGTIANTHADAIIKNKGLRLNSVSEIDIKKGEKFALEKKCKFYRDYQEMLKKEDLDIAAVCLPHHLHYEAGMAALKSGCHLLMEKPMARSVKECDQLIKTAKTKKLKLMVGQTHQYYSSIRKARQLLTQGKIGNLKMVVDTIYAYYGWEKRKPWFLDPIQGGGGPLMNTGPHQIDHLLYFSNSRPVYVRSVVMNNRKKAKIESDVAAYIEFKNGVSAVLLLCQGYVPKTSEVSVRLIGDKGMMEIDPWGNVQLSAADKTKEIICSQDSGYAAEWEELLSAIKNNRVPVTDGQYGKKVVALIDAIYRSSRENKSITLSY